MQWPTAAGALRFYKHTLVCRDEDGYAVPGANYARYRCVGFTRLGLDQPASATAGQYTVDVQLTGVVALAGASLLQRHCGNPVWLTDDQTISLTRMSVGPVGHIVEIVSSTEALVLLSPLGG